MSPSTKFLDAIYGDEKKETAEDRLRKHLASHVEVIGMSKSDNQRLKEAIIRSMTRNAK